MFTKDHEPIYNPYIAGKRPGSSSLEDTSHPRKKTCQEHSEPGWYEEVFESVQSDLFPEDNQQLWGADELPQDDCYMELGEPTILEQAASVEIEGTESKPTEICDGSLQPDTCLGVVVTNAISSFFASHPHKPTPVQMHPFGNTLKLCTVNSEEYAGLLKQPVLIQLLSAQKVKLSAVLVPPEPLKGKTSGKQAFGSISIPVPLVRMVVHGQRCESLHIGKVLSNEGLYLQPPLYEDVDAGMEYYNPHYLVRPGSRMPRAEDLSENSDDITGSASTDERTKYRLMGIFNSADDQGIRPTTEPSSRLRSQLKDHQLKALAVMSEKECLIREGGQCPSLWEASTDNAGHQVIWKHRITRQMMDQPTLIAGGILADDMGLGKSLSILSLICWSKDLLETTSSAEDSTPTTLIVAPLAVILSWRDQIDKHIIPGQLHVATYHGSDRIKLLTQFDSYDIILTTYETLRLDWDSKGPLYGTKWFRVVLDEAHRIGNRSTQIFRAACDLTSTRRWCLTGTPIQNSLDNYGALLSFLHLSPFIEKPEFDRWIANPVRKETFGSLSTLRLLVQATCLRRTKESTARSCELVDRKEVVQKVNLSPKDRLLHNFFQAKAAKIAAGSFRRGSKVKSAGTKDSENILPFINFLRLICNHGEQMLPRHAVDEWTASKGGNFISTDTQSITKGCSSCLRPLEIDQLGMLDSELHCGHLICAKCWMGLEHAVEEEGEEKRCPACIDEFRNSTEGDAGTSTYEPSAKVRALISNLRNEQGFAQKTAPVMSSKRSVVFSYWSKMLDIIQETLRHEGFSCARIDGNRSIQERSAALQRFSADPNCSVMLATVGSAGEGIDLTPANHVHIMEPQWNPATEEQAIARVHRIGQQSQVIATRYITPNSIEEYVRHIQNEKLELIRKALDSAHSSREVAEDRLKKLARFLESKAES